MSKPCPLHMRRPFSALQNAEHALVSASGECSWKLIQGKEEEEEEEEEALISVSASSYSKILKKCCDSLIDGRIIHDHIIRHGYDKNIYVVNCLGYFYGNFGALREAYWLFRDIFGHGRDVFSWNFLIRAYAKDDRINDAFECFQQMHVEDVLPDKFSFICLLSSCDYRDQGMSLHACIIEHALETQNLIGNALISFYGKCGRLEEAHSSFGMMSTQRDIVSWNSIISAYAQYGEINQAFSVFEQMLSVGMKPDKVTFIALLSVSADKSSLDEGRYIHMYVMDSGYSLERTIENALVNMYGKCGILTDARNMFESMNQKDIVSWNAIITAYVYNEEGSEALQLYSSLLLKGWMPNKITLMSILDACASEGLAMEGRRVHTCILCSAFVSDIVLGTAIVHMYGACKASQGDARIAFDQMPERNLFSWNTIIAMYTHCGEGIEAFFMYKRMQCESILPNHVTFVTVISACADLGLNTLLHGKCIHCLIISAGSAADVVITTSLLHMYGKHGCLKEAYRLFECVMMPNLISWNAIMAAYAHNGHAMKVYNLVNRMKQEGLVPDKASFLIILCAYARQETLPMGKQTHACLVQSMYESDISVANALVNMYGECHAWVDASNVFECMPRCNVFSWNALMGAYVKGGQSKLALQIFHNMQHEGVIPDEVTFICVLDACLVEMAMEKSKQFYVCFMESGLKLEVALASSFINIYGKCGRFRDAQRVFDESPKHKVDTWNSMISVYAQSGEGKETLHMLSLMEKEGVAPNEVTFVSVLTGCSHGGLVLEGFLCFGSMTQDHRIKPKMEHYNCLIDMLGRVGRLDEADYLIRKIVPFPPTSTPLLSLLASCRHHRVDVVFGEYISNLAFMVDPEDCTPYIMLWNIYATACNVDELCVDEGEARQNSSMQI